MGDWVVESPSFIEQLMSNKIVVLNQNGVNEVVKIIEEKDKEIERLKRQIKIKDEIKRLNNIINELEKHIEEELDRLAKETSHIYEDSLGKTKLVNEDIFEELSKIKNKLQELKEEIKKLRK